MPPCGVLEAWGSHGGKEMKAWLAWLSCENRSMSSGERHALPSGCLMLKNQKDPGAPLRARGTWRVRHSCSRLELGPMGWGPPRGLGGGEERREGEQSRKRPLAAPCKSGLNVRGRPDGQETRFVWSSRLHVYTVESAPRKSVTSWNGLG